ncbi:hypothetical protein SDC9_161859 [bioreactor metagenome]|uniref:Uncharacterized protein n=1 Tax=bioreactor metagenome TaxID=1076179 RepID=A0A645FLU7_9ZZZZ
MEPEPWRPRPLQDLRRLQRRRHPQGRPDADPGQDHQGLRHGPVGRGNEHLAPAEEDGQGADRPLPRPLRAAGPRRQAGRAALPEVPGRLRRIQVHARTPHGPGRLPAHPPAQGRRPDGAGTGCLWRTAEGLRRRPRTVHHNGHRAHHEHAAQGQADRQAHRADRARREPHLRHGRHVPPVRHLEPGRPEVRPRRP